MPKVLCGSSIGSIVAAICGTDKNNKQFFVRRSGLDAEAIFEFVFLFYFFICLFAL